MKKFIAFGLLLGSLSVSAQSYLILNNGVTLTTDRAGFLYDFGHFVVTYDVKVAGGSFFVEKDVLNTIDENGFRYEKDLKIEKVKGKGLNYVLDGDKLVTIDAKGFFYKYDKDDMFKRIEKFGGNFFLAKDDKKKNTLLYVVNDKGNYLNIALPELNPANIAVVGGQFFITNAAVTYTISKDGFVYRKDLKVNGVKKAGGNFVIDNTNKLFTISDAGVLANPVMPVTLNLNNVVKTGANYLLDGEGRLFVVDKNGNVFERSVNSHDLRSTKVVSQ